MSKEELAIFSGNSSATPEIVNFPLPGGFPVPHAGDMMGYHEVIGTVRSVKRNSFGITEIGLEVGILV